jgi:hypothetical protein
MKNKAYKSMTDFEHQCLMALVSEYGAEQVTAAVAGIAAAIAEDEPSELQYYAAARDDGWSFGDEDSPKQYCDTNLEDDAVDNADTAAWKEEFEWWKAKP